MRAAGSGYARALERDRLTLRRRWFLPDAPDLIGRLQAQTATTVEGMEAMLAWARGDESAAQRVRELEHEADHRKRELRDALTQAFAPPLDPEDLFALSQGVDEVLNSAKDTVREAEVMRTAPDAAMAEMAEELAGGTRALADAFAALSAHSDAAIATAAADRATRSERNLEHIYRRAASALLDVEDAAEVTARRELYRRMARTAGNIAVVAERVWFAVLKQT